MGVGCTLQYVKNFITSWNAKAQNKKYILLSNLRCKHGLFVVILQKKKYYQIFFAEITTSKLVRGTFAFAKN